MYLTHLFTDEEKALREMIRKFTEKEIMPVREKMEEDRNMVDAILQKLVDLGIQKARGLTLKWSKDEKGPQQ